MPVGVRAPAVAVLGVEELVRSFSALSSEMITVRSDSQSSGSYKPRAIRSASMNNSVSSASVPAVSRYVV